MPIIVEWNVWSGATPWHCQYTHTLYLALACRSRSQTRPEHCEAQSTTSIDISLRHTEPLVHLSSLRYEGLPPLFSLSNLMTPSCLQRRRATTAFGPFGARVKGSKETYCAPRTVKAEGKVRLTSSSVLENSIKFKRRSNYPVPSAENVEAGAVEKGSNRSINESRVEVEATS